MWRAQNLDFECFHFECVYILKAKTINCAISHREKKLQGGRENGQF